MALHKLFVRLIDFDPGLSEMLLNTIIGSLFFMSDDWFNLTPGKDYTNTLVTSLPVWKTDLDSYRADRHLWLGLEAKSSLNQVYFNDTIRPDLEKRYKIVSDVRIRIFSTENVPNQAAVISLSYTADNEERTFVFCALEWGKEPLNRS